MDFQTFTKRSEAEAEMDKMMGWRTRPIRIFWPQNENADAKGYVWVIECDGQMFLRDDGYIR